MFSLKLVTSLIATPDEIAQAISDPDKRKLWDLDLQDVQMDGKNMSVVFLSS